MPFLRSESDKTPSHVGYVNPGSSFAPKWKSIVSFAWGCPWVLFSAIALFPTPGQAQSVDWARSGGGPTRGEGLGIAVDNAGNSYVTGTFEGTATFGSFTLTSAGSIDLFVAKYDTDGNVLWVRSAGGPNVDAGRGIGVDFAGNVYLTGYFVQAMTFGVFPLTSAGLDDAFVAKYDTNGNFLWARSGGGNSQDQGRAIAVDVTGNSYVTGRHAGTSTFAPFTLPLTNSFDVFIAKYDSNGNILWVRSAGGTEVDESNGIAVDGAGNSYITGSFGFSSGGTAMFGPFTLTSAGLDDAFVAKYDSSGGVVWARSAGGPSRDAGRGIAVDAAGNSYVTGPFTGTAAFGPLTVNSAGISDVFVAKYDSDGSAVWAKSAGGATIASALAIAADPAGNSYVTGLFLDAATFGPFQLTSAGLIDLFVAKYSRDGVELWALSAGGMASDIGQGIAADPAGNSYVTGKFGFPSGSTATFGSFTLTATGDEGIFVAKIIPPPIPAVSQWGVVIMTLLVLTVFGVLSRRTHCRAASCV